MNTLPIHPDIALLEQQAQQYSLSHKYSLAARCYEQAITAQPDNKSYYWYLGLMLLLQGQEAEAQLTWMMGMNEGEAEDIEQWTIELVQVLENEAEHQNILANYTVAVAIRHHIREIDPTDVNNILHLIELENYTSEEVNDLGIIELIQNTENVEIQLLLNTLKNILDKVPLHPVTLLFTKACLKHIQDVQSFFSIVVSAAIKINYSMKQPQVAISLLELCLLLQPGNIIILLYLADFYRYAYDYRKTIETAKLCLSLSEQLIEKICASYILQQGLIGVPVYWHKADEAFLENQSRLRSLIEEQSTNIQPIGVMRLYYVNNLSSYLRDIPHEHRRIQNEISQLCQLNVETYAVDEVKRYQQRSIERNKKLKKIGYISHYFCRHSVGWLARWLINHHNKDKFDIYGYFVNFKQIHDPLQEWYAHNFTQVYKGGTDTKEIAEKIYEDEIDILIDLDSITIDATCEIMARKPAPLQVTWLGWDAAGIPTIDYFIADPYVLPESAQEYYTETIWRLPQTYIAVDGFEVSVATVRREDLDIPNDSIVYFSGQKGFKRHPDTARLQMKIIKEVPNSYFLIKGIADSQALQQFFMQLADEEGVDCSRLRFLPVDPSEAVHRANLAIADVVLDTYPYNGATTTLETLWMGIPLVTRVGEQFAARNSYTMMMNAGITEGIAWTDEEYVEWGVHLGKDEKLRQQVAWKLRQSKHTAPIWNSKQFTRDMENAYEQMWQRYSATRK